ncbi:MAG: hypothetical protein ACI8UO_002401 [Verrucomicrobiales bacterium]|jgi:hypothetical protein
MPRQSPNEMSGATSVFISHNHRDDPFVDELATFFKGLGFKVFNDKFSISAGERITPICEDEIRSCDQFILVHSENSAQSEWVAKELKLALDLDKQIIPIRLDDTPKRSELGDRLSYNIVRSLGGYLPQLRQKLPVRQIAPSRIQRHAPEHLIGREPWLAKLDDAWRDPRQHVVVAKAWGGIGKTALVAAWMAEMEFKGWRDAKRVFDWSFYSQGTRGVGGGESAVSADSFIAEALAFFGDPDPQAGSPADRGQRLAELMAESRSLLVLDGIEPLQHPPGPMAGYLTDPALESLLRGLATRNPGLCIVTTREHIVDLDGHKTAVEWPLDQLSEEAGAALLHAQGADRAGDVEIDPDDAELREASREVDGHALTLTLMGKYLALACDGDIRRRDTFALAEADPEWVTRHDPGSPYGHAFKVIAAYERWFLDPAAERSEAERRQGRVQLAILRLLGLFNRPASPGCLVALREEPVIEGLTEDLTGLSPRDWTIAVSRLEQEALLKRDHQVTPSPLHPVTKSPSHPGRASADSGVFQPAAAEDERGGLPRGAFSTLRSPM